MSDFRVFPRRWLGRASICLHPDPPRVGHRRIGLLQPACVRRRCLGPGRRQLVAHHHEHGRHQLDVHRRAGRRDEHGRAGRVEQHRHGRRDGHGRGDGHGRRDGHRRGGRRPLHGADGDRRLPGRGGAEQPRHAGQRAHGRREGVHRVDLSGRGRGHLLLHRHHPGQRRDDQDLRRHGRLPDGRAHLRPRIRRQRERPRHRQRRRRLREPHARQHPALATVAPGTYNVHVEGAQLKVIPLLHPRHRHQGPGLRRQHRAGHVRRAVRRRRQQRHGGRLLLLDVQAHERHLRQRGGDPTTPP